MFVIFELTMDQSPPPVFILFNEDELDPNATKPTTPYNLDEIVAIDD